MSVGVEAYCEELGQSNLLARPEVRRELAPAQKPETSPTTRRPPKPLHQRCQTPTTEPNCANKRLKTTRAPETAGKQKTPLRNKAALKATPTIPNLHYQLYTKPSATLSAIKIGDGSHLDGLTGIERRRKRQEMRRLTRQSALAQTGVTLMLPTSASTNAGRATPKPPAFAVDANEAVSNTNTGGAVQRHSDEKPGFSIQQTRLSKPGWMGLDLRAETKKLMNSTWGNQESKLELRKALLGCQLVPYEEGLAVAILDSDGLVTAYRSRIITRKHLSMSGIMKVAQEFVNAAQHPYTNADMRDNARGNHWFSILGYDRNNRKARAPCTL
ncbi:hypothetical protein VKT23_014839 [Stygiomarasmius scandens]|uniref:Uncharacterized protein n=1 Tax=Marasmiellus scandens TaxID=2682957 RepID=A0ABR1J1T6_9AGAR